jgi:diacylglycerol kinase family enzyme
LANPQKTNQLARGVLLSVNPRAGAASSTVDALKIQEALNERGFNVHVTTSLDELRERATQWHTGGQLRAVIVAGGDGTASVVRAKIPDGVPMVPLPMGTESLLARHVRQSADPDAVFQTLTDGISVQVDMGIAGNRPILLMASVGFDAEVVRRLHLRRKGNIGRAAYVRPTFETIAMYDYPEMRVSFPGSARLDPLRCRWIFIFNLPLYACGLRLAPSACGTDGLADVCAFERGSVWRSLRYLWAVARGHHEQLPDCRTLRASKMKIESADGIDVPVQIDGDWAGHLPIDIEIVPHGLTLLVPPEGAERLGCRADSAVTSLSNPATSPASTTR